MWWIIALPFGFRARDESRLLKWADVTLEKDPETENDILVWRYERGSKTRQGQDKPYAVRAFHPTAQGTGTERCPVKIYKEFACHRPLKKNKPYPPFYLAVKHQRKPGDDVWYMRSPLGKNEIGKFLSTAAKNATLHGRVTNRSVRKTCISRLLDANVSNSFVAQLSGHRNLKSLDAYQSASYEHQRRMSLALSRSSSDQATISARTETTTRLTTSLPLLSLPASIQSSWDRVSFQEQRLEALTTALLTFSSPRGSFANRATLIRSAQGSKAMARCNENVFL